MSARTLNRQCSDLPAGVDLPKLDGIVIAAGGEKSTGRTECHAVDAAQVSAEYSDLTTVIYIPQGHCVIPAATCQKFAVRTYCDRIDTSGLWNNPDDFAGINSPEPDARIQTGSYQGVAVWAKDNRSNRVGMSPERSELKTSPNVPQLYRGVVT